VYQGPRGSCLMKKPEMEKLLHCTTCVFPNMCRLTSCKYFEMFIVTTQAKVLVLGQAIIQSLLYA
jgi:hypothetical protein